jgi:hypothetical protein
MEKQDGHVLGVKTADPLTTIWSVSAIQPANH